MPVVSEVVFLNIIDNRTTGSLQLTSIVVDKEFFGDNVTIRLP